TSTPQQGPSQQGSSQQGSSQQDVEMEDVEMEEVEMEEVDMEDAPMSPIVSSTIIRPVVETEDDRRTQRRKRTFPDAPEPARRPRSRTRSQSRSNSGSHSPNKQSSHEQESGDQDNRSRTESFDTLSTSAKLKNQSSGTGSNDRLGDTHSHNQTGTEASESRSRIADTPNGEDDQTRDSVKRVRTMNVTEDDKKRGKRMMGMILGTLSQFKRQQTVPRTTGTATSGDGSDVKEEGPESASKTNVLGRGTTESGLASREAVQERVRERLRREKEAGEERARKERDDREARLRETLLKQIAGRSSVPGRARVSPSAAVTVHSSSRPARSIRYENGYIMTETRPRLRYMPKVMNVITQRKFDRQVENNPDQRAIAPRNAHGSRRDNSDHVSAPSPPAPRSRSKDNATGHRSTNETMDVDENYTNHEQPSAEAVAKAEVEAARELDAGMDLDLGGPSSDNKIEIEDATKSERYNEPTRPAADVSETSSVTVQGSPTTTREESEDVPME
ncbi:hypothetical protein FBU30_003060, partial [Linnemannia zychae]